MKKIAITGGIGSGKSFICKRFSEKFNTPIYYSDVYAKKFMLEKDVQEKISLIVGENAYIDGELNKPYIRKIFYTDKKVKKQIDEIIIKKMIIHFDKWCEKFKEQPYILYESAIIFEKNREDYFDKIITITVSDIIRKERVLKRDKLTEKEYQLILNNQISDNIKILKSDFVIDTTELSENDLNIKINEINKILCQQKYTMG